MTAAGLTHRLSRQHFITPFVCTFSTLQEDVFHYISFSRSTSPARSAILQMTFVNWPIGYSYTRHRQPPSTIKTSFPFTSSRTFTNFSKLPAELRIKIWRYCLPKPRAIPIFQKHYREDGDQSIIRYECFKPHPTILAVNRESRMEALKFYVMIHGPHKFWVAFDNGNDTIYGMTPPTEYTHGDLSINLFEKPEFECLNRGRDGRPVVENEIRIKSLAVNEADLRRSG
jgi:hypothetical protein